MKHELNIVWEKSLPPVISITPGRGRSSCKYSDKYISMDQDNYLRQTRTVVYCACAIGDCRGKASDCEYVAAGGRLMAYAGWDFRRQLRCAGGRRVGILSKPISIMIAEHG